MKMLTTVTPFLYLACGICISAGMVSGTYPLAIVGMVGFPMLMNYTKVVSK